MRSTPIHGSTQVDAGGDVTGEGRPAKPLVADTSMFSAMLGR
jgi:hypothetical protein